MTAGCTSTTETIMARARKAAERPMAHEAAVPAPRAPLPKIESPIVPHQSIGGRALVAVVAIMTFLASLTTGAVMLVRANAAEWQTEILREVTIQIRPVDGRDLDAAVKAAVDLARCVRRHLRGAALFARRNPRACSSPGSARGLAARRTAGAARDRGQARRPAQTPDIASLRKTLVDKVPGASLDDHRGWIDRMRAMADFVVLGGILVLALVIAATILSVSFATRGAMAANRPVIEVLHFIGAQRPLHCRPVPAAFPVARA